MPLPKFAYLAPTSLKEASAMLSEHGDRARIMAGGTDLLIRMSHRALKPEFVIGLRGVPDLDFIRFDKLKGLKLGALARLRQAAEHPEVLKFYPALAQAAAWTATVQIRNMGTVAGNICNAAPSADTATPLLAYGANVLIQHPGGERSLPLDEFFRGPGLTALERGEVLKEIQLPPIDPKTGSSYQKISERSKVDIAAVGVSALVRLGEAGEIILVRIALGAVAPIPLRARRAEKLLKGQKPDAALIAEAGRLASDEASPITDVRASAHYRRRMVDVLTVRAVEQSLARALENAAGCDI